MKKSLFALLALVSCTFAMLSCDKDKKNNEDEEVYLTLAEQQQIVGNVLQQVADKIDLTQLENAVSKLAPLKDLPFDDIFEAAKEDAVLGQIIDQFRQMEDETGNLDLDLSRLNYRFNLKFVPVGEGVGSYMRVTPQFELVSSNHDRFQIDMINSGQVVSVWLKGEGSKTTVEYLDGESHYISVPRIIKLGLDIDGKGLFGLTADIDTDLKVKRHSYAIKSRLDDGYDDSGSDFSIECSRLNLALTLNAAQYAVNGVLNYVPATGFKLSASIADASSKTELLKIDAGLDGTLQKEIVLDEAFIMAWVMDSKSCRKVWADASVLSGEVSVKMSLDNPFDGIPAQDRVEYMNYIDSDEDMPANLRNRLMGQIMPYFNNGIYFKGYDSPQSKLVFKASDNSSVSVSVESCSPNSGESMSIEDFILTDKVQESVGVITQKFLPLIGLFSATDK